MLVFLRKAGLHGLYMRMHGAGLGLHFFLSPLELHGYACFFNGKLVAALQVFGQAHIRQTGNQPFGGVDVKPLDAVAIVVLKQVVVVVITLTVGEDRQEIVVARGVLVGVRAAAPNVRQRIDKECGLMAPHQASQATQQHHAPQVAHQQANNHRQTEVNAQGQGGVVFVLEHHQRVFQQVR